MSDADRVKKVLQKNFREQRDHVAEWMSEPANRARMYDRRVEKILEPFLADGAQKKLVPAAMRDIRYWHLMQAMQQSFNNGPHPQEQIALAGLHAFWHLECAHAIMESDDPAGYKLYLKDFDTVSLMLALGWPDHAIRLADTLFDRWDEQEGGAGNIAWEALPQYVPWLSIKLYRAWSGDEIDLYAEPEDDQLDGFAGLAKHVLHEDPAVFTKALLQAADFHVLGSGVDDYGPVREYNHWFLPVELLAACRIRELKGLEMPEVAHPLFEASPLCRLHPPVAVPEDALLAKVLPAFAKVTGTLDLDV